MSVRKFCSQKLEPTSPLYCAKSPACEHHWFYDFRVNRRRYRNTTETADKQTAKKIEALERSRILHHRHGIREQPDITFRQFVAIYVLNYAAVKGLTREQEIVPTLNRAFGSLILHEITALRIEQFKRERLAGKWRGHLHKREKRLQPATVNRELDTLSSIFTKAVEWGKLREHPMAGVEKLKVDNRRTRILSEEEQTRLLAAFGPRTKRAARLVTLALMTGARIGEVIGLRWADCADGYVTFYKTKNGKVRKVPIGPSLQAVLEAIPRTRSEWVSTSPRTRKPYTVNGVAHVFRRALARAGITSGDVTLHTLRHTALSQMIAGGSDDFTVRGISGHSSTKMLDRYTHPTDQRKIAALESYAPAMGRMWAERESEEWKKCGGRREARTRDLRVANAKVK